MSNIAKFKMNNDITQLEEVVLGAILTEAYVFPEVASVLKPSDFSTIKHQLLYEIMCEMHSLTAEPIDLLSVTAKARHKGILEKLGGAYGISELTMRVNSAANVTHHAYLVKQESVRRQTLAAIDKAAKLPNKHDSPFELLDACLKEFEAINNQNIINQASHISDIAEKTLKAIQSEKPNRVLSYIPCLDEVYFMRNGELEIIAARPGMGKTAFAMQIVKDNAKEGNACAFFSLEMSEQSLVKRYISSMASKTANRKITVYNIEDYQEMHPDNKLHVDNAFVELSALPIYIDDTPALSLNDFASKAKQLKYKHDLKLIVIDYVQLMESGDKRRNTNREQEISTITRSLKTLSKVLDLPIIALCQLSREVEKRADKKPQLSDLRESGSIEQDADSVIFLYRPEYYNITVNEAGEDVTGKALAIIGKQRNGATSDVVMGCQMHSLEFYDDSWG